MPKKKRNGRADKVPYDGLRIIPLGGLGEIGKNITALECGGDIIVIDCGMKFPEENMLGIDFVLPDVQYLCDNKDKVRGIFITHGHEDHIGALPLVAPRIGAPIYGSPLALAIIENKMTDARISYKPEYHQISPEQTVKAGCFEVGFIRVSHSIPDSFAIYVRTPIGTIFHSGDFKLDVTPIGMSGTDLPAIAALGSEGVTLLMSDSTNSERPGFTPSETMVSRTFGDIFRTHKDRRIVIAAFASNLHRAGLVFAEAARFNRKVVLIGRSLLAYTEMAMKLGYFDVPKGLLITSAEAEKLAPNRTVVLTTGSQGEPFSGLVLMSKGEHRQIHLGDRDLVVVSATPIPGNEKLVSRTIDRLFACGCDVIYGRDSDIHVSGHASREEQKTLLSLVKPKYFVPVHGEYRHLVRHGKTAREMGIPSKNIFVMQNGDVLTIGSNGAAKLGGKVQSGAVLVDGMMLGECEGSLLRERRELSESGIIALSIVVDKNYNIAAPIKIESKGCILGSDTEILDGAARKAVASAKSGACDMITLPTEIRKRIREIVSRNYRIYPTITPMITMLDG
ncbi:ribonuclease J [Synergistales bacterium]|nr:ribonuclease J [Synergistales bacterium]